MFEFLNGLNWTAIIVVLIASGSVYATANRLLHISRILWDTERIKLEQIKYSQKSAVTLVFDDLGKSKKKEEGNIQQGKRGDAI